MIGKVIAGRYSLVRMLGDGGMGAVYKAEDNVLRRFVAIKLLHPAAAANPAAVERFLREAQAAASIGHPNIIDILDFGEADQKPYLVMEYLRGRSLADAVHTDGPLPIKQACSITTHALAGLQAAHDRGILHRDLKPANLMLVVRFGDRSFVKLLDFGFAALLGGNVPSDKTLTPARTLVGTPAYAAPERLRGDDRRDPRTDLYSLGVVLFEMLAGVRPFDASTFSELARKVQNDTPPSLRLYRPDAPEGLERVIAKALAKKPDERWSDAESFAAALVPFGGRIVENDDGESDSLTMDLIKIRARERKREPAATSSVPAQDVDAHLKAKAKDDDSADRHLDRLAVDRDRTDKGEQAAPPTKPMKAPAAPTASASAAKPAQAPPPPPPPAGALPPVAAGLSRPRTRSGIPPPPPTPQAAAARAPAAPTKTDPPIPVQTVRSAQPDFSEPVPAPAPALPEAAVSARARPPEPAPRAAGMPPPLTGRTGGQSEPKPARPAPAQRAFEGSVGLAILRFVSRRYGERALKTVLDSLTPDVRAVFAKGVGQGSWISFEAVTRLVETIDAKLGRDDLHLIADCGRAVAEGTLDHMKKLGPPTPPPELLLAEMPGFVESLVRGVECKVRSVGRGYGRMELDEFDHEPSLTACVIVLGFLDRSLTRFGAREVEVNLLSSRYLGDDENIYDISWLIT
jgi:serine/threonine-protein kinase